MKVLEIETKADELMTVFPRGKKKLAISGITIIFVLAIVFALLGNSSDSLPVDQPRAGSDLSDLSAVRPTTGISISGAVTINQQIPLPCGFVVAYGSSMRHAIAACPIQRDGTYKLRDVPPGPLILVVKPKLTDDLNAKIAETSDAMPGLPRIRKTGGNQPVKLDPRDQLKTDSLKAAGPPSFPNGKQPSKATVSRFKASVVTPEMESIPEIRWMIDYAFYKFNGSDPHAHKFVVPEGEGEKIFFMPLIVP